MKETNVEKCIHCGLCTRKCIFLEKYKLDLSAFSKREDLAYLCFMCEECTRVCPKDIDGKEIALQLRQHIVQRNGGKLKDKDYFALNFEKNPYKFSNYKKGKGKAVWFPGCNFTGFYPKTAQHLSRLFEQHQIGVVYDCCSKPVYELGQVEAAQNNIQKMSDKLKKQGVEELITACPNCYHFLKDKVGLKVVSVYQKLQELGIGRKIEMDHIPMFYPCSDRGTKEIMADILPFLSSETKVENAFPKTLCCGLGGCSIVKEKEFADAMIQSVKESQEELYTYCASCTSHFKRKGYQNANHLLSLILDVQEEVPLGIQPLFNRVKAKFK